MPSARDSKRKDGTGFVPCSTELAYCSDCQLNRRTKQCPRQREQRLRGDYDQRAQAKIQEVER